MGIVRKLCHKVLISLFVLCVSFARYSLGQVIYVESTEFSRHFEFSYGSPLLTIPVVFLLWSLLPLIICYRAAGRKGKSRGLWMLLAIIFGWIAVLVIAASASER